MSKWIITAICYVLFAPFIGGIIDGIDRKFTARMQGRKGPSILQPFFDVAKLFKKSLLVVNNVQIFLILSYLILVVFSGVLLFSGMDMLISMFALTTAEMFLVLAASSASSPYSEMGAHRELFQMLSYEPMMLLTAIGFYAATGAFKVSEIVNGSSSMPIKYMPGFFLGFVFILTIKMRKSPFDISTSHHAHQEVVKGLTTEMVGGLLGAVEIAEWYENVLLYGIVALFFLNRISIVNIIVAVAVCFAVFFFEIIVDNVCARVKWKQLISLSWLFSLIFGGINLIVLMFVK